MKIDKKIIADIKAILFATDHFFSKVYKNRLKLIKWIAILLALFILYRVYKIITHHKMNVSPQIVNNIIPINKAGYYKIGFFVGVKQKYFYEKHIIANVHYVHADRKTLPLPLAGTILTGYAGKILINHDSSSEFHNLRYAHLEYKAVIKNYRNRLSPFFLFYISFNNPNEPGRILYTPINIPMINLLRVHTVLAKIRNNGFLKLTLSPNVKKPKIAINKLIYFYPIFNAAGNAKSIDVSFEYRYKRKYYTTKDIEVYSGNLINIYGVTKNKKNKGRNLELIKVNIAVKMPNHQRGDIHIISLELIRPDASFVTNIFKSFVFKRYFSDYIRKSTIFHSFLEKAIDKDKYIPARTFKKHFINNILNQIILYDFTTKITQISKIHNKIIRSFYAFIYKRYESPSSPLKSLSNLLLSSYKKPYYKNILIPIRPEAINFRIVSENNKIFKEKRVAYININFKKEKLYRYFTGNKHFLSDIVASRQTTPSDRIIIRGSNDDYWYGKHYYGKYPLLIKLKSYFFNAGSGLIKSYFYFKNMPKILPAFLFNQRTIYINNKKNFHYSNILENQLPYSYNYKLKIYNKYNLMGPYNFFRSSDILRENIRVQNINNTNTNTNTNTNIAVIDKHMYLPIMSLRYSKIYTLKFNVLDMTKFSYILIPLYVNKKLKKMKKWIQTKVVAISFNRTKIADIPSMFMQTDNGKFILLNLKYSNKRLNDINEFKLSFIPKKFNLVNLYEFKKFDIHTGNRIILLNFKKSDISTLHLILQTPLIKLMNISTSTDKVFTLKSMSTKNDFNSIFKKGRWIYKTLSLTTGDYYFNPIVNPLLKISTNIVIEKIK